MSEEFLYYIWEYGLFQQSNLVFGNDIIEIISVGRRNLDSGPDFHDARIRIGQTIWAGNVEIHVNSSDWYLHGHEKDHSFDNVILHVVYSDNEPIFASDRSLLPCIELKGRFKERLFESYNEFKRSRLWVPCFSQIPDVSEIIIYDWLSYLSTERLEERVLLIQSDLKKTKYDWEQVLWLYLFKNFGFSVNSVAAELLSKSFSMKLLYKYKDNFIMLESLLFGQAGMLEQDFVDEYPRILKNNYHILREKHTLAPVDAFLWKYLRMRPSNFPSIRLAQLASVIHNSSRVFSDIIESKTLDEVKMIFKVKCSDYWDNHYLFDKISIEREKKLTNNSIFLLIINTITPFLFTFGKVKGDNSFSERAINLLNEIPAENNSIISNWKKAGVNVRSSFETQALLQLKNKYCDNRQCLKCRIGNSLLKKSNY